MIKIEILIKEDTKKEGIFHEEVAVSTEITTKGIKATEAEIKIKDIIKNKIENFDDEVDEQNLNELEKILKDIKKVVK